MKKLVLFIMLLMPLNVWALEFPEINSGKAIVYDLTGDEVLYEKNSNELTSIASLTKILTSMTAIEEINNLDEQVTVTKQMLSGIYFNATRAGLKENDIVTYRDLLYAALLPSGADATNVLAYALAGDVNSFVLEMNDLATRIGMSNTVVKNPIGLDASGQYSTLNDVLILLKYALNNKVFREVFTTRTYTLTNGLEVKSTLRGYEEKLNIDTSRILGSKTGTTDNAGLCLASLFNFEDHEMVIITTNAPLNNKFLNLEDHLNLINFIDNNYVIERPIVDTKEEVKEIVGEKHEYNYQDEYDSNYPIIIFGGGILLLLIILIMIPNKKRKR